MIWPGAWSALHVAAMYDAFAGGARTRRALGVMHACRAHALCAICEKTVPRNGVVKPSFSRHFSAICLFGRHAPNTDFLLLGRLIFSPFLLLTRTAS